MGCTDRHAAVQLTTEFSQSVMGENLVRLEKTLALKINVVENIWVSQQPYDKGVQKGTQQHRPQRPIDLRTCVYE